MTDDPTTDERQLLAHQLSGQRAHVLGIVDGLDARALVSSQLPSGWTFAGMVNHLTVDVERFWFRGVLGGEPMPIEPGVDGYALAADLDPHRVLTDYQAEVARSEALFADLPLDAEPQWWPAGIFGDWQPQSAREIALHVITETACHAGHLDAARELFDGRTWLVLG